MTDVRHSYAQTGSGPHKIGVSIDLFSSPKSPPKPKKAEVESNRVTVGTPKIKQKPKPQYHIDLQAMQRNIEKLTIAEQRQEKGMTPRDLYFKAHAGLMRTPVDYTDPRQWYNSAGSKKMMRKLTKNIDDKDKPTKSAKSLDKNAKLNEVGNVSFLVTFPSLSLKPTTSRSDKTFNRISSENGERLPHISYIGPSTNLDQGPKFVKEKTQLPIQCFSPNIDESQSFSSARKKKDEFGSTDSLDSIGRRGGKSKFMQKKQQHTLYSPHDAETPPSALDRELTKSMEDILKSVTGPENVHRSLKQPPHTSIKFPNVDKTKKSQKQEVDGVESEYMYDESQASPVNWETGVGLRKTYSYQSLNDYSLPIHPYEEDELSTRLVKVSSQESLYKSRDKFKKLRLPQQRATVEEITSFRNTYGLRQRSVLKLNMKSGFDEEKVSMNKIQVSPGHVHEYVAVPSKLGPYIQGKIAQQFIVAPDVNGEINPLVLTSPQTPQSHIEFIESNVATCPGTSFSLIPNDDSSEVNTLKTQKSVDDPDRKSRKDVTKEHNERSRSRSKSKERAQSEDGKKPRKGALSRGSNVSNRSKSKEAKKRKAEEATTTKSNEDENGPKPSARSPSSNKVLITPISKQANSTILPPSQKALSKPYIPPKLKKHKHHYADSLDTLLEQHGNTSRSMLVGLALNNKAMKRKKKQMIRGFDKYLITKLGGKLQKMDETEGESNSEIDDLPPSTIKNLPHPPHEFGKRPVFRRMKTLVPFDERGRPVTQGKEKPIVNEEFPSRMYVPTLRPQGYRMDTRQYPANRQDGLTRDVTFDKKSHSIIDHGLERSVTIGEMSFPEQKPDYERSDIASSVSTFYNSSTHRRKPNKKGLQQSRHRGGHKDHKKGERFNTESDLHLDSSRRESDEERSRHTETPVDSITASMMKEIYDNLDDYLDQSQEPSTQFSAETRKELVVYMDT